MFKKKNLKEELGENWVSLEMSMQGKVGIQGLKFMIEKMQGFFVQIEGDSVKKDLNFRPYFELAQASKFAKYFLKQIEEAAMWLDKKELQKSGIYKVIRDSKSLIKVADEVFEKLSSLGKKVDHETTKRTA